ncbi:MAG: glycosyl hydrolase [Firmicutes bacterium]|jgi:beta-glucosidase|nr:glycosyl hydrolase [Bacillota bacterium]
MSTKINQILAKLTLEEKAALCSGINNWETTPIKRLEIPAVMVADGPHGLRKEVESAAVTNVFKDTVPATCFPPAVTLASTWDTDLAREVGNAIASESLDQGVSTVLGPGINIKRSPLCGRNFEYFSEDPYLTGELAAAYIQGVQENGIGTSLKHYAVNSQEYRRLTISAEVDERALREIYLKAFEIAVKKSQPYTIMCSYNLINGVHASDNRKLLGDILRKEWGFEGMVVSDWGAVNDRVKGIVAGLDLEMPSSNGILDREIIEAVRSGRLDVKDLDIVVGRILQFVFRCASTREKTATFKADYDKNHLLARKAAASGAVLLKNEDGILPFPDGADLAVIGQLARNPRYQGSGSSRINPRKLVSFCDHMDALNARFSYAPGYTLQGDGYDKKYIDDAVALARNKEYVLVFIGLTDEYESESFDRTHLEMPRGHNELVRKLCEVSDRVVVALNCGSPVNMPWLDRVAAVLNLYLGGEAGGEAAHDLLFGMVNPSGKLAETFPLRLEDGLSSGYFGMGPRRIEYRESIFVGYRDYDTGKKEVLFPFGYGLSYTNFSYANLELGADKINENDTLTVSFELKNTGKHDGAEVAQIYIRDTDSTVFKADKELKGFKKVFLKKGETRTATIDLDRDAFAFYNTKIGDWCVESGDYEILVGSSSRDIRLQATVKIDAVKKEMPDLRHITPFYYDFHGAVEVPLKQFEALIGREMPPDTPVKRGEVDFNSTIGDIGITIFGKIFKWAIHRFSTIVLPKDAEEFEKIMVRKGAMSLPLRSIFAMTDGAVTYDATRGLLVAFNGQTCKGLFHFARAMLAKKPPRKTEIYVK